MKDIFLISDNKLNKLMYQVPLSDAIFLYTASNTLSRVQAPPPKEFYRLEIQEVNHY